MSLRSDYEKVLVFINNFYTEIIHVHELFLQCVE